MHGIMALQQHATVFFTLYQIFNIKTSKVFIIVQKHLFQFIPSSDLLFLKVQNFEVEEKCPEIILFGFYFL